MKQIDIPILIASPIDFDFLKKVIEEHQDSVEWEYTCEDCQEKFNVQTMVVHKDFVVCKKCALNNKLDVKNITFVIFEPENIEEGQEFGYGSIIEAYGTIKVDNDGNKYIETSADKIKVVKQ